MDKTGNILAGFLLGAVAGVVTGILVAPHSGSKTRKLIKKRVNEAASSVTEEINDQIDNLEEKIKNVKKQAEEKVEFVKAAAKTVENTAKLMGIDVTKKDFWISSLELLKEDIELFLELTK